MTTIAWDESLAVGVEEIDAHHRELAKAIAYLQEAVSTGQGRDRVTKVLEFIATYSALHFAEEEGEISKTSYPRAAAHTRQHREFTQKFDALRQHFLDNKPSTMFAVMVQRDLVEWWLGHVGGADRAFADYLQATKA
ncbi:MAG: bacteriohemerythrin [Chloroflexota bacterium]